MNNEDIKKSWPKDSFKRAFPDCKDVNEAFNKVVNKKPIEDAAQADELVEAMRLATKSLEEAQKDFDIDRISLTKRQHLANMPLSTVNEINLWRDAWISAIETAKW